MSHKVTVNTQLKDLGVLKKVCDAKGLSLTIAEKGQNVVKTFSGEISGIAAVSLPGWKYPVVLEENGVAHYDNYNGSWGNISQLDKLTQDYARELTLQEASQQGFRITYETVEADGTIKMELGY